MNKILSVGGFQPCQNEVTNIESGSTCEEFVPDFPLGYLYGAVIGLIDNQPTVYTGNCDFESDCWSKHCYQYNKSLNVFVKNDSISIVHPVEFAAYAAWQDRTIILAGGNQGARDKTNLIQVVGSHLTWTMPINLTESCMVHLHGDTYLLMGGYSSSYEHIDDSYVFTPYQNGTLNWTEGPKLQNGRSGHACGVMERNGKRYVVVVGGSPPFLH